MNLVEKAKIFAFKAHGEQKRKYSDEPYTNHLLEVVGLLTLLTETTETMFAAAWLHVEPRPDGSGHDQVFRAGFCGRG